MNEIPPKVATAHRTKREVDFAEIKAWLTRFEGEDIDDMSREDLETDLEVATASYVPVLLDEVLDAERALTAAGIPDDGRPLAERVESLLKRLRGAEHDARLLRRMQDMKAHDDLATSSARAEVDILKRATRAAAITLGAQVPEDTGPEALAQALRDGVETAQTAQATLRAAKLNERQAWIQYVTAAIDDRDASFAEEQEQPGAEEWRKRTQGKLASAAAALHDLGVDLDALLNARTP